MAVNPIASDAYARAQALPAVRPSAPAPGALRYDGTREPSEEQDSVIVSTSGGGDVSVPAASPAAFNRGSLLDVKI